MLGWFKRKGPPTSGPPSGPPSGFPIYGADEFAREFSLSAEQADRLAADYHELLVGEGEFATTVAGFGNDLSKLSPYLKDRYGFSDVPPMLMFVWQIANVRREQAQFERLKVREAEWLHSGVCGEAKVGPYPSHGVANGQKYDPKVGLMLDGAYTLPGTLFRCSCRSVPVLDFGS